MASDFRLKDQLPDITERIVQTYEGLGTINHLDHCPLPSYEEVIASMHELTEILFPGYRRRTGLHRGNISYYAGPCDTKRGHQAIATANKITKRSAKPKRSNSSISFPSCEKFLPPTCKPRLRAIRPARMSTK